MARIQGVQEPELDVVLVRALGGCSVLTEFSDFYGAGANSSYLDCNSSRLVTFSGSNCDGAVLGNYTNGCYTTPYNGTSYTSFSIGFNVDIGSFCSSSGSQGTTTTGNQGTTTTTTTTSRTGNSGSLSSWLSLIF